MKFRIAVKLLSAATILIVSGCATGDAPTSEKPPRFAKRVQVAVYDKTPRPPKEKIEVYDAKLPGKTYKEIASLTCESAPREEAVMMEAILYRARLLGADGVIIQQPDRTSEWTGFGMSHRRVFRGKAILYER